MARLYANENFPLPVIEELRRLGHDVLTTLDAGNANQALPDEEVLAFSMRENRALLTMNRRHFLRLVERNPDHTGLILCTFDADSVRQAQAVHASIAARDGLVGQVLRVNWPS